MITKRHVLRMGPTLAIGLVVVRKVDGESNSIAPP
jgi:hypothetical protein